MNQLRLIIYETGMNSNNDVPTYYIRVAYHIMIKTVNVVKSIFFAALFIAIIWYLMLYSTILNSLL